MGKREGEGVVAPSNGAITIEIVSATRLGEDAFWANSALGLSLRRLAFDRRVKCSVEFGNTTGLGEIFNRRIGSAGSGDIVVLAHDDIWLDDFFFADHVIAGLSKFDVVGVAGNRRRLPRQPAWCYLDRRTDGKFNWDDGGNLRGAIGHGSMPFGPVTRFGASGECELLDGVLLAARRSTLEDAGVLFDPRFEFHLYDMDFCRSARAKELSLGAWPIAITHQSDGRFGFGGATWERMFATYLDKWGS